MQKFKERFDTLSDAIVAIAMTILVLEIKAPLHQADWGEFLRNIGLFAVSFIVIFNFWYQRTQNNLSTSQTNDELIALDVVNHLAVCLVPLFTKLMMTYDKRGVAVAAYGLLTVFISVLSDLIRLRLVRADLVENIPNYSPKIKAELEHNIKIWTLRSNLLLLLFAVVAYYYPNMGIYAYLIVPLVSFVRRYRVGRELAKAGKTTPAMMVLYTRLDDKRKARKGNES